MARFVEAHTHTRERTALSVPLIDLSRGVPVLGVWTRTYSRSSVIEIRAGSELLSCSGVRSVAAHPAVPALCSLHFRQIEGDLPIDAHASD